MSTMFGCSLKSAYQICVDYLMAGITPSLESSPGLGKSALAKKIAKDFNLKLIDIRLSQVTPEDLMGLPMRNEAGRAYYATMEMFPLEGDPIPEGFDGWLLFFDEFNSAAKSVQAAAYKPILDHMVGQERLHENCYVMSAGNLQTDRAIVINGGTAIQSRVGHITIEHNEPEFMEHMIDAGFDYRVRGFIDYKPEYGHYFDPDHHDRTFSCPRTLEFLSDYVKPKATEDITATGCAGLVSDGVGVEFVEYIKEYANLPKYGAIVAHPDSTGIPQRGATCFAVTSMLIEYYDRADFKTVSKYISRFSPEFQIPYYRAVKVKDPAIIKDPQFKARIGELTRFLSDSELTGLHEAA